VKGRELERHRAGCAPGRESATTERIPTVSTAFPKISTVFQKLRWHPARVHAIQSTLAAIEAGLAGRLNVDSGSVSSRLRWAFVAWLLLLPSATGAGADGPMVQQIGDLRGRIAEAVAAEVAIVPFSPRLDARATPIILATGKVFLGRDGKRVLGLRPAERRAIRQAYAAGQVILLLSAEPNPRGAQGF